MISSNIPIVMLTAMDSDEYIIDALDAGADDHVTKDSDPKVRENRASDY